MRTRILGAVLMAGLALAGLGGIPTPAAGPVSEPAADAARVERLIGQLGSDAFAEREAASKALAKIGPPALPGLRKAVRGRDTEVRKRARELLGKIEAQAAQAEVMKPTTIHLVLEDTPVSDAVAVLRKKSGAAVVLHDPEKKLAGKKVTLDTGKVTFWEALDRFCAAAGVVEGAPNAVNRPVPVPPGQIGAPGGAGMPAGPPGRPVMVPGGVRWVPVQPVQQGQITLVPGKPAKPGRRSTDVSSAVRVRSVHNGGGNRRPGERGRGGNNAIGLVLEATVEPRLRWQSVTAVKVTKAIDDGGTSLKQAEARPAQVPGGLPGGVPGVGGGGIQIQIGGPLNEVVMPAVRIGGPGMMGAPAGSNGLSQLLPVNLVEGEVSPKSLKELSGTIEAQLLAPATEAVAVKNLTKAAGKTVKGDSGGEIRVDSVTKNADGSVTVQFQFTAPNGFTPQTQLDRPVPMPGNIAGPALGGPVRIQPVPPPAAIPPAGGPAGGIAVQAGRGVMPMMNYAPFGLTLRDDKGNVLPAMIHVNFRGGIQPGGAQLYFVATYRPGKDGPAEPARLVFTGRKAVRVSIPFTLKDVELP